MWSFLLINSKRKILALFTLFLALSIPLTIYILQQQQDIRQRAATPQAVPAFPGAEGFGANSIGGRGGQVIKVTNINDSGTGSLRAALESTGPRIVVFEVTGTITLASDIDIVNPFITIAGQTAPGDGIQIKNATIVVATHNVIIRGLRVRPGDDPNGTNPETRDGISVSTTRATTDVYNVIIDHSSFSWSTDGLGSVWTTSLKSLRTRDVTLQWNIFSEALSYSLHPSTLLSPTPEPHSMGVINGARSQNTTIHHNLMAHNRNRNPSIQGDTITEVINNVSYNYTCGGGANLDGSEGTILAHIIGNFYDRSTCTNRNEIYLPGPFVAGSKVYVKGNIGPGRTDDTLPDSASVTGDTTVLSTTEAFTPSSIVSQSALEAKSLVLQNAGAIIPTRDSVDSRIVAEVETRTGNFIDSPSQVGGYPILATGSAPLDSDNDGMPDVWETDRRLKISDPTDANQIAPTGYTWIEEYINSLITMPGYAYNQYPYAENPASVPGKIEAEDFDIGGQNISYSDKEILNKGGQYRKHEGVDIEATTDTGGGYAVTYTRAGEWIEYTINVATTGVYDLDTRVSSASQGGTFRIQVDGVDKTQAITVPSTGSWQSFVTLSTPGITLTSGQHVLRVAMESIGLTGSVGNFNYFSLQEVMPTSTPTNSPTPPSSTPTPVLKAGINGITDGETVRGIINVRYETDNSVTSKVEFYIDDVLKSTERGYPYYLNGDTSGVPNGYDTNLLVDGGHTLKVMQYDLSDTPVVTETLSFIVANNSRFNGIYSGQTVNGNIYVCYEPLGTGVTRVVFAIDGITIQSEVNTPYCLKGDINGTINPFDTTQLANGSHLLQATITQNSITTTDQIPFNVSNTIIEPTATPTLPPTLTPTPTITPTPTPATVLALTLKLHGVGQGGDSVNPTSTGNTVPITPQRPITLAISSITNVAVANVSGTISYNTTTGIFTGSVDLSSLASGSYVVKVTTPKYLAKTLPGVQTITQNQTNSMPTTAMIAGDVNGDNALNILDYNMIMDCYSDLNPPRACSDLAKKQASDIDDDGKVNQYDYNLFIRELSIRPGD